jgi:hypothetical protein
MRGSAAGRESASPRASSAARRRGTGSPGHARGRRSATPDLPEHRRQAPPVLGLRAPATDPFRTRDLLDADLALGALFQMVLQQHAQRLARIDIQARLKLVVRQPGRVLAGKPRQRVLEALPRARDRIGPRRLPPHATRIALMLSCRQDLIVRHHNGWSNSAITLPPPSGRRWYRQRRPSTPVLCPPATRRPAAPATVKRSDQALASLTAVPTRYHGRSNRRSQSLQRSHTHLIQDSVHPRTQRPGCLRLPDLIGLPDTGNASTSQVARREPKRCRPSTRRGRRTPHC